ncbi:MAG: 4Fe-4S binding protein [bacterium]
MPLSLFGRIFCRFICPAGTIQDITNNISRRISGSDAHLYSHPAIKYVFLVFILILCFDLDASFFLSCYYWIPFVFGIFLFLSSFTSRYWCRLLCPIGLILSLSKFSPFKIKREALRQIGRFRGKRTVLLADMEGSTELFSKDGDIAAAKIQQIRDIYQRR